MYIEERVGRGDCVKGAELEFNIFPAVKCNWIKWSSFFSSFSRVRFENHAYDLCVCNNKIVCVYYIRSLCFPYYILISTPLVCFYCACEREGERKIDKKCGYCCCCFCYCRYYYYYYEYYSCSWLTVQFVRSHLIAICAYSMHPAAATNKYH